MLTQTEAWESFPFFWPDRGYIFSYYITECFNACNSRTVLAFMPVSNLNRMSKWAVHSFNQLTEWPKVMPRHLLYWAQVHIFSIQNSFNLLKCWNLLHIPHKCSVMFLWNQSVWISINPWFRWPNMHQRTVPRHLIQIPQLIWRKKSAFCWCFYGDENKNCKSISCGFISGNSKRNVNGRTIAGLFIALHTYALYVLQKLIFNEPNDELQFRFVSFRYSYKLYARTKTF